MALSENLYNLTTRELKKQIREKTKEVNARVFEYRLSGESHNIIETEIRKLKSYAGTTPKKYEIGVGNLSKRHKSELQRQLAGLERFIAKDVYTPAGLEEHDLLVQKQYETFVKRYADETFTREDYTYFVDTMNVIKNVTKNYGYENYGKELAEMYGKANTNQRQKFVDYVQIAVKQAKGTALTPEDIIDNINEMMKKP